MSNQTDDALLTDLLKAGGHVVGASPRDAPLKCCRRSPLSLAGRVKTPTLVVAGETDHRIPASEVQHFYAALQLRRFTGADRDGP